MDLASIGLKADSSEVAKANRELNTFSKTAAGAEASANRYVKGMKEGSTATGRFRQSLESLGSPLTFLKANLLGIGAALGLGAVSRLADEYTSFTNRLKVAGVESDTFAATQERLFEAANAGGAQIGAVGQLYAKATLAGKDLGASQEQLMSFIDGVTASLKVNGGTAASSSGALLQLSQALGGGVVRAEEFNSILEGAPTIAQAAANGFDGVGGSVSALRNLVIAGNVSSKDFFDAFLKGSEQMKETAASLNITLGGAFTTLTNGLILFIGTLDQSIGVSSTVAAAIQGMGEGLTWLAMNFDLVYQALVTVSPILAVVFGPAILGAVGALVVMLGTNLLGALNLVVGAFEVLRVAMMANPILFIGTLIVTAITFLYQFREELGLTTGKWAEFWQVGVDAWNAVTNAASVFWETISPLLSQLWEVVAGVADMIGGKLVSAFQYLWPIAKGIIDGLIFGLQKTVDLINYLSGADAGSAIGDNIERAVDGAAEKIKIGHEQGGATASQQVTNGMTTGGIVAGDVIKQKIGEGADNAALKFEAMTAQQAEAIYEGLNGKVIKPLGDVLMEGGKFIRNEVTGEIRKAGSDAGEKIRSDMTEGGAHAGSVINDSMVSAGSSVGDSMFGQLAQLGGIWSNQLQGFIGDEIIRAQQLMNSKLIADTALVYAQAEKALTEARLMGEDRRRSRPGSGSGGGGRSGSGGGGGMMSVSPRFASPEPETPEREPVFDNRYRWADVYAGRFARGGAFDVPGTGGGDKTRVSFDATPGEKVRVETAEQQRQAQPKIELKISNVVNPKDMLAAMSTSEGQKEFLNVIATNREMMQSILGVR